MRWALRVAVVASLLALVLSLVVIWRTWSSEWDPLGPYPEQSVQPSAGHVDWTGESYSGTAISIPAVKLGDVVTVTGTKCSDEDVTIDGTKGWTSRDPAGATFSDGASVVQRTAGCRTATYANRPPTEVADWVADELVSRPFVVVMLGGCEKPVDNQRVGKTECWRTEPFAFVKG